MSLTADRVRPAAYIRAAPGADLDWLRAAVTDGAQQRGWPAPEVYAEEPIDLDASSTPVLARLEAAIEAGRHDALLVTDPGAITGSARYLVSLLFRCTRNGVVVGFLIPAAPAGPPASAEPPQDAAQAPNPLSAEETWDVLARARLEALAGLFPDWRIWLDQRGWHARRRQSPYLQVVSSGAPAYYVHSRTATELAAQLCWQQAADRHAPDGCSAR
ncbi:MAG TPA: recombinase family protein [Streptosporangiaceae bacterium]|jgi:hypothetical protein